MSHVGYIPRASQDRGNPYSGKIDARFKRWSFYNPGAPLPQCKQTHGIADPNHSGMVTQAELFDQDYEKPLDPKLIESLNVAQKWVVEYLDKYGVHSELLELDDIDFNMQSSPGVLFSDLYENKGDMLMKERESIYSYMTCNVDRRLLWKLSPKRDYLPFKKIYSENFRCFEIPPLPTAARGMSVAQAFNKKLYSISDPDSPIRIGVSFQHGGFHAFVNSFATYIVGKKIYYGEGDCEKYDKYLHNELRRRCKDVRIALYRGTRKLEFIDRINLVYKDCMNAYLVLPWGQVLKSCGGMLSGDPSTTADNTIAHLILQLAMVHYYHRCKSMAEAMAIFKPELYADDHLFSTSDPILSRYSVRREFYGFFGIKLKEEDDKVQINKVEGMKFLGATIVKHLDTYVPKYDASRLYSAIIEARGELKPRDYYNKLLALLYLSTYADGGLFQWLQQYLQWHVNDFDKTDPKWFASNPTCSVTSLGQSIDASIPYIPSWNHCDDFWKGHESAGVADLMTEHKKIQSFGGEPDREDPKQTQALNCCMSFAYHGNYCGPGWTDGEYKNSQSGNFNKPPIDEFDSTCRDHDRLYASGDYLEADKQFAKANRGKGFRRNIAGYAVHVQSKLRELGIMAKSKKNIKRGASKRSPGARSGPAKRRLRYRPARGGAKRQKRILSAPTAIASGPGIGRSIVKINGRKMGNRITVSGHEQLGQITITTNVTPGINVFSFDIAPQNFTEQRLSVYAGLYEKYRFKKFVVRYTPQVGTQTAGQLIHWFEYDPQDIDLTGTAQVNRAQSSWKPVSDVVWKPQGGIVLYPNLCAKEYFTSPGDDNRLVTQAVYNVTTNSNFTSTIGTLGTVEVDYVVEFFGSEINSVNNMITRNPVAFNKSFNFTIPNWTGLSFSYVPLKTFYPKIRHAVYFEQASREIRYVHFPLTPGVYRLQFLSTYTISPGTSAPLQVGNVTNNGLLDFEKLDERKMFSVDNVLNKCYLSWTLVYYFSGVAPHSPSEVTGFFTCPWKLDGTNITANNTLTSDTYVHCKLTDSKVNYGLLGSTLNTDKPRNTGELEDKVSELTEMVKMLMNKQDNKAQLPTNPIVRAGNSGRSSPQPRRIASEIAFDDEQSSA